MTPTIFNQVMGFSTVAQRPNRFDLIECKVHQKPSRSYAQSVPSSPTRDLSPKRSFSTQNSSEFSIDVAEAVDYTRMAESICDVKEAVKLNESKMCVNAILELLAKVTEGTDSDGRESLILDVCAGKG